MPKEFRDSYPKEINWNRINLFLFSISFDTRKMVKNYILINERLDGDDDCSLILLSKTFSNLDRFFFAREAMKETLSSMMNQIGLKTLFFATISRELLNSASRWSWREKFKAAESSSVVCDLGQLTKWSQNFLQLRIKCSKVDNDRVGLIRWNEDEFLRLPSGEQKLLQNDSPLKFRAFK